MADAQIAQAHADGMTHLIALQEPRLWFAALRRDRAQARQILEGGASVDEKGGVAPRTTPLQVAAIAGHATVVKLLLEHNADASIGFPGDGENMQSILYAAVRNRHEAVAELLIQHSNDVSMTNTAGILPLAFCANRGFVRCVSMLLERGVDACAKDNMGWTALHRAAYGGHVAIIRLLRMHGAKVLAECNLGNTAEDYATRMSRPEAAKVLEVERVTRSKCVAFAMGYHARLGAGSLVRTLHVEVIRILVRYVE